MDEATKRAYENAKFRVKQVEEIKNWDEYFKEHGTVYIRHIVMDLAYFTEKFMEKLEKLENEL